MGTRNLTAVYLDGEYKIAQYGQWDGYPEGQGKTCLEFARKMLATKEGREAFSQKVRACSFITDEETERRNAMIKSGEVQNWTKVWPELCRDTCAGILELVAESENGLVLANNIEFAADSLFCEWGWVVDLDKGTFEGFEGFNEKQPSQPEDRFYFLKSMEPQYSSGPYYTIRKVAEWSLDELPTYEEFLAAFTKEGD